MISKQSQIFSSNYANLHDIFLILIHTSWQLLPFFTSWVRAVIWPSLRRNFLFTSRTLSLLIFCVISWISLFCVEISARASDSSVASPELMQQDQGPLTGLVVCMELAESTLFLQEMAHSLAHATYCAVYSYRLLLLNRLRLTFTEDSEGNIKMS